MIVSWSSASRASSPVITERRSAHSPSSSRNLGQGGTAGLNSVSPRRHTWGVASVAGNSGSDSGLLGAERVVLAEIGALVDRVASTDLLSVSREELAEIVTEMAAESERLSAMAGRFMEVGERSACSYTKGERTMIGLVNAKGRLSRRRAASIRRAGRAVYRYPSFHAALLARRITLAHVDAMTKWAKKANTEQVRAVRRSVGSGGGAHHTRGVRRSTSYLGGGC